MSDRISKLESKLGGQVAFGHTNTPPPNGHGRGSRSSSSKSGIRWLQVPTPAISWLQVLTPVVRFASTPGDSSKQIDSSSAGFENQPSSNGGNDVQPQVPFPAAQAAEQPMAAVAQSLGGPNSATTFDGWSTPTTRAYNISACTNSFT